MAKKPNPDPLHDYLGAVSAYEREFKKWEGRVDKILKRYRDDNRDSHNRDVSRFNILWSNVQTLVQATYSRTPQPDVSRRFRDQDPVGRVSSLILERGLEFEVQHYPDYQATLRSAVYDRFLGGRGTAWVRYEPHIRALPGEPDDGVQVTEDTDEAPVNEELDYECAPVDYVHWKDFGHSVARSWEEVTLVWRKVYMSESAVTERFGEDIAKRIPYDATPEDLKRKEKNEEAVKKQALVYELWDKEKGIACWFSKSLKEKLDEQRDPLGLKDFFPCPKPLYATMTNDSLVPVPDFTLYQDQANELDILAERIDGLIKMLQLKGVYDGSADPAIARLFTEGETGTLMPIKNWAAFAEKQGLKGSVDVFDMTPIAHTLEIAQEAMEQVKNQVYEITGISDLIRGETAASETATAQQIKGKYASMRLRGFQMQVAQFATELLQLKAQVMCSKFSPETLLKIAAADQLSQTDQQLVQPAMELLIGPARMADPDSVETPNPLRSFRVEVAADTLVQLDEQEEKDSRMEMLTSFGTYLDKVAQIGAMAPQMAPLLVEVGKFGLTAFKVGKTVEGSFDQALEQLKAVAMQPQQPKPDPQMEKVKLDAQLDQQRIEKEKEVDIQKIGMEREKNTQDMQLQREQHAQQMQFDREKHSNEMQMKTTEHENAMALKNREHDDGMKFKRQELASKSPETAPVDKEGNAAASPTMQMAEEMKQVAQLMAQIAQGFGEMLTQLNQTMKVVASPKRLIKDPRTGEKTAVPVNLQ